MRGSHETNLSPDEERGYRDWMSRMGQAPGLGNLDKNWNHKKYDMRGVYKKFGPVDVRGKNLPDEFRRSEMGKEEQQPGMEFAQHNDSMDSANPAPWLSGSDASGSFNAPWASDHNYG